MSALDTYKDAVEDWAFGAFEDKSEAETLPPLFDTAEAVHKLGVPYHLTSFYENEVFRNARAYFVPEVFKAGRLHQRERDAWSAIVRTYRASQATE